MDYPHYNPQIPWRIIIKCFLLIMFSFFYNSKLWFKEDNYIDLIDVLVTLDFILLFNEC